MMDDNRERKIKKENIRENLWQKKKKKENIEKPSEVTKESSKEQQKQLGDKCRPSRPTNSFKE